jgi:hypothetical protein
MRTAGRSELDDLSVGMREYMGGASGGARCILVEGCLRGYEL